MCSELRESTINILNTQGNIVYRPTGSNICGMSQIQNGENP